MEPVLESSIKIYLLKGRDLQGKTQICLPHQCAVTYTAESPSEQSTIRQSHLRSNQSEDMLHMISL